MKTFNHNQVKRASRSFKQAGRLLYILGIFCCGTASGQTAMELFNPPAKEYILGNNAIASNLVTQAVVKYPNDEKLQKLKKLIEQQQKKQDKKKQDQQKQDQKKQDQKKQDQQKQDQQKQDQQKQDQKKQDQQKKDQQKQDAQPSRPQKAGEMSQEEAKQLLDSMKQNEKDQRTDLRPYLGQPVRVDKDW